jgi:hypothetical protein
MTRMGDIVMICRHVEVQDEAAALPLFDRLLKGDETFGLLDDYLAARRRVWRVESAIHGLSYFRPVLRALRDRADFESEAEARAHIADIQARLAPMSLNDVLHAWADELKVSLRECGDWFSFKLRRRRWSRLDDGLP